MKKYELKKHNPELAYSTLDKEVLVDITCDICQKTCRAEMRHEELEEGDDLEESDFEYLEIKGSFGYYSKRHDTEAWNAQICEDCSENYLEKIVCFTKHDYMTSLSPNDKGYVKQYDKTKTALGNQMTKDFNDFVNERADRIRKIRKLTGEVEFKIVNKNKEED